ncbi:lipopolysaccharide export system protein LptA [Devosia lucknowensis]|uniref:Lipopolysaccharide export system protein LptA n=1 Tax=Devosia lucknowensis TaxID=1096929 RepID=A0A1Y6GDD9_9HYPH|nr:LptA/OstA family protein [Devosia lucknowensis]SMQ85820.1 lipopolysaccharide export system protein LptA [Devosia lucknowensis]
MKPIRSIFVLLLMSLPVLAQNPVEITSDKTVMNDDKREVIFTGDVVVVHPTVTVWAPEVIATYGEGGTSDIETFVATGGNVRLKTKDQDATGEHAVYTPGDQLLRLTGNVVVTNASGTVNATELVVNLATSVSTFTSGGGGRVTGVFTSQ